jgi:hypothetical protein
LTLEQFFVRLIHKRPLTFFECSDITLKRDGKKLKSPDDWYLVGTDNESPHLTMEGINVR